MEISLHIALSHATHFATAASVRRLAPWLALALLALPVASRASPHTEELFNEAMSAVPQPAQGAKLYQRYCMECHGSNAFGDAGKTVPSLASQIERYVVKQLVDFSELDRDAPEMHRLAGRPELGQPQAWRNVAAYLAGLRPNPRPQLGSGHDLERGARSYQAYCVSCHGAAGEGLEKAPVPALRGQHYSYLLLQLKSFDADRRGNLVVPLAEHMIGLSRADRDAIADYLSRLPSKPRPQHVSNYDFALNDAGQMQRMLAAVPAERQLELQRAPLNRQRLCAAVRAEKQEGRCRHLPSFSGTASPARTGS